MRLQQTMDEAGESNANPVLLKDLDDGGSVGPTRQRFEPKHKIVLHYRIPWRAAKAVPEPRPTDLVASLSPYRRFAILRGF